MPNDMIKGDCPNVDNVARPSPHRRVTLLELLLVSNIIYEDFFLSLGSYNTHTQTPHIMHLYTHIISEDLNIIPMSYYKPNLKQKKDYSAILP